MGLFDIFKRKKEEKQAELEQLEEQVLEESSEEESGLVEDVVEPVEPVFEQPVLESYVEEEEEDDEDEFQFVTEYELEEEYMEELNAKRAQELAEQAEAERLAREKELAEQAEAERIAREEAEKVEAERAEAERLAREEAEQAEAERLAQEEAEKEQKKGFFGRLISGLSKTRNNITDRIDRLLNDYGKIDDELFEELEEILITADIGMDTTMELIDDLRNQLIERKISEASGVKAVLKEIMTLYLTPEYEVSLVPKKPTVILVIGVNGAGKTTSIGKIANLLKNEGNSVLLAAADTFRAAAIDQLKIWGDRVAVDVIAHSEGSDPSAVVYDACQAAKARKIDALIIDTAGRLHNKVNLMKELNKIFRTIEREFGDAHLEVLLVLDATTGQNAVQQAKLFKESAPLTGLVLTKLDGTAKGGFVFAIRHLLDIPVKLIGVGEKIEDLQHFNPEDFANAIME